MNKIVSNKFANNIIALVIVNTLGMLSIILSFGILFGPVSMGFVNFYTKKENDYRDFIAGFKIKFKKSLCISVITMLVIVLLFVGRTIIFDYYSETISISIYVVYFATMMILVLVNIYIYQLLYLTDLRLVKLYMESLAIGMYKFGQSFLVILVFVMLGIFLILTNPVAIFIGLALCFKFQVYISSEMIKLIGISKEEQVIEETVEEIFI